MSVPTSDPSGRSPSAKPPAGSGVPEPDPAKGSTGSHRPAASRSDASLSDLLRGNSSVARKATTTSDVIAHLAATPPGASPPDRAAASDEDDAPTVITQAGRSASQPATVSPPPYILGESPSLAGRRLGHFELIEAIGSGGMAAVLKARDLDLGRIVALKILPPDSATDPESVTRFKQEARAAARLDHENVARVYYCGEDQGLHFIAFEFVEGVTLRQLIDRRGRLPVGDCTRYMIQIAAGLAHAADRSVVHRDIKPSNVIITPDGRAKIVDMGLARHLESGSVNGGVTQSGVTLGTFDYISPEQALDPRRADVRSDIYSLGCTFYHALTGRPPVPEGTAAKKLHAHQYVDPLDPRELNSSLPDELAAILARMMAKNPDRRYQTPTELIAHLKAVAAHLHIPLEAVSADSVVQTAAAPLQVLPKPPQLRFGWAAAGIAIAAVLLLLASSDSDPSRTSPAPHWPTVTNLDNDPFPPDRETKPPVLPAPRTDTSGTGAAVKTADELANAMAKGHSHIHLSAGTFDLSKLDHPVLYQGQELTLIGVPNQTEILVAADPAPPTDSPQPGTLTLKADSVSLQGVRLRVAPPHQIVENEALGEGESTGLTILDAARIEMQDCLFLQVEQRQSGAVAVGVYSTTPDTSVRVNAERCLFGPGGIGLRLPPRSSTSVKDCGFGPLAAAILVRGDPNAPVPTPDTSDTIPAVRFDRSTFMVDAGSAAVRLETPPADLPISAGYCVFAPVGTAPGRGAVIRTDHPNRARLAVVAGRKNVLYGIDPVATAEKNLSFEECRNQKIAAEELGWVKLERRPWDTTGDVLAAFLPPALDPYRAFRLRITGAAADPDLFVTKLGPVRVLGAIFEPNPQGGSGRVYTGGVQAWPPENPALAASLNKRVWWPSAPVGEQLPPRVYRNLVVLLQDAQSGDEVLIRHTGLLPVSQQVIEPARFNGAADSPEFKLTFKPEKGHLPTLTPVTNAHIELSLFQVIEGRVALVFEGLHFLLKPGSSQETLAAVTLVSGQRCDFRNCAFTIEEREREVTAAVALADPGKVMKMDGPMTNRVAPRVTFTQCLIRGRGRLLTVPASRPFELKLDQCVTALNGPVLYAKAANRDPGGATPSTVSFNRVTALLGGPLVELQAGKVGEMRASGLVPTTLTASGCLFVGVPGAGRPILEVHGTELDPTDRNGVVRWERGEPNRFANFEPSSPVAVIHPDLNGTETQNWDWDKWTEFAREVVRPFGTVAFHHPPESLKALQEVKPTDLEIKSVDFPTLTGAKRDDAGAEINKLPAPARDESGSE